MPNGTTNPWSESNSPSLRGNQGDSLRAAKEMWDLQQQQEQQSYFASHPRTPGT
jgi:hypothetical protein